MAPLAGLARIPIFIRCSFYNGFTKKLTVLDVGESDTVHCPQAVRPFEFEGAINASLLGWKGNVAKSRGKRTVPLLILDDLPDHKAHDFVRTVVVFIVLDISVVAKSDILPGISAKVNDDLPSLGHADLQSVTRYRLRHETCIGANDMEWNPLPTIGFKIEFEGTTDRRVEDAESVFAWFNLKEWPGLPVDLPRVSHQLRSLVFNITYMDDIPKERVGFRCRTEQGSVSVVLFRVQG